MNETIEQLKEEKNKAMNMIHDLSKICLKMEGELGRYKYTEDKPYGTDMLIDEVSYELDFYFKEGERKGLQIPHIKINGDEMHISELIRMYTEVCKERMR